MKRAGNQIFKFINNNFKKNHPLIVLCGPGNNGGDGFVAAKQLMDSGFSVEVYIYASVNDYSGDAFKALKEFKGELKQISLFRLKKNALIVDALFGIGLKRSIKGKLSEESELDIPMDERAYIRCTL